MIEANDTIANQQYEFDEAINKTLKRVQYVISNQKEDLASIPMLRSAFKSFPPKPESFKGIVENDKRSFVSVQSLRRSFNYGSFKASDGAHEDNKAFPLNLSNAGDQTLNHSVLNIVHNNITPKTNARHNGLSSFKKSEEKSINSHKLLKKIFKLGDLGKGNEGGGHFQKVFEEVQDSLSISEREAIVYALTDDPAYNKDRNAQQQEHIKVEEVLAIDMSSPALSQHERLKQNTVQGPLFAPEQSAEEQKANCEQDLSEDKSFICDTRKASSMFFDPSPFNMAVDHEQPHDDTDIFELIESENNQKRPSGSITQREFVLPSTLKQKLECTGYSFRRDDKPDLEKTDLKNQITDNKGFDKLKCLINRENISPIAQKSETVAKRINFDTFSPIRNPNFEAELRQAGKRQATDPDEQSSSQRYEEREPSQQQNCEVIKTPTPQKKLRAATHRRATQQARNVITPVRSLPSRRVLNTCESNRSKQP